MADFALFKRSLILEKLFVGWFICDVVFGMELLLMLKFEDEALLLRDEKRGSFLRETARFRDSLIGLCLHLETLIFVRLVADIYAADEGYLTS